jgi:hypothetical protein
LECSRFGYAAEIRVGDLSSHGRLLPKILTHQENNTILHSALTWWADTAGMPATGSDAGFHHKVEGFMTGGNDPKAPIKAVGTVEVAGCLSKVEPKLSADVILHVLRNSPSGLTAKEVADRLGGTASNIGSRLSKLAAYGVIQKSRARAAPKVSPCAVYSLPLSIPSAPDLTM